MAPPSKLDTGRTKMMDWEMLLALAGVYILLIGIFFHHWLVSKRMMKINQDIYELTNTNNSILESIHVIETYVLEGVYKKDKK